MGELYSKLSISNIEKSHELRLCAYNDFVAELSYISNRTADNG